MIVPNDLRPRAAAGAYAVFVLFTVNLTGYLDRQILTLLVQPIRTSLNLTDGEIGLLQGLAFVLIFCAAGLFMGRLVDRLNRRNLLFWCVAIWTVATMASGFARSGGQMFVARMFVGIGEAALVPAAVSIVSDYFTPDRRGLPMGIFVTGTHIGSGFSLLLVGLALPTLTHLSAGLGARGVLIEPWRMVMIAMFVPGLFCCALLRSMAEPARTTIASASIVTLGDSLRVWRQRAHIYLPHHIAAGLGSFCLYASLGWFPSILIRERGFSAHEAGIWAGTMMILLNAGSALWAGRIADAWLRKGGAARRLALTGWMFVIAAAAFVVGLVHAPLPLLFLGIGVAGAMLVAGWVVWILSLADLTPPETRGQCTAILFLVTGILGNACGPAIVGFANDWFGCPSLPLSRILALVCVAGCLLGLIAVRIAVHTIGREAPINPARH